MAEQVTVSDYARAWHQRQQREGAGRRRLRVLYSAIKVACEADAGGTPFGALPLAQVDTRRLVLLRQALLARMKVSSARQVVGSQLRAMLRDARVVDGHLAADPFANLPRWQPQIQEPPDPLTEGERTRVLAWMRAEAPAMAAPFALLLYTGIRPCELVALTWPAVDLERGMLTISRSRTAGEDRAPKTARARRTIRLGAVPLAELRAAAPTAGRLCPLEQEALARGPWRRALRETQIRARKLYTCRHTAISLLVSAGAPVQAVAEYMGTSARMIETHYARWVPSGPDRLTALLG